ncbi:glycosyltransferase family 87 protein [Rickettsiella grylli]|uniref:glycosyltransferase family 87 protein n=1 Tax=Rickettsiella grylli TaxID=59196 RepID=UPI000AEE5108|nr:glycosyltransferase family 87 protein [Rickettsiella grylli]
MRLTNAFHRLLFLCGVVLLITLLSLYFIYPLTRGGENFLYSDFGKFYHSQRCFIHGKNIYTPVYFVKHKRHASHSTSDFKLTSQKSIKLGDNLNPPFFTLITFPFAYLSYPHAFVLWTFISIISGAIGILLLQQKLNRKTFSPSCGLLLLIGLFSYFPSFINVQLGQVSLILLPLVVLGWRAARNEKTSLAAFFLGLAASLKPFLGLFLFYFLMRKEWRALGTFLITLLCCSLIAAFFLGIANYRAYYHVCQHISWAASSWNVSFYGFLLRLLGGLEKNIALFPLPGLINILYPLISILFFLALIQFLRPQVGISSAHKIDLDFSAIIVGMFLLSPLGWIYYFPLLCIPFFILWQFSIKGIYPIGLPLFLMTCIFVSNIPMNLIHSDMINTKNVLRLFLSSSLYFLVLLSLMSLLFGLRYYLPHHFSLHFERIPQALLLLMGVVAFLPAYQGIGNATLYGLLHNSQFYSTHYPTCTSQDLNYVDLSYNKPHRI